MWATPVLLPDRFSTVLIPLQMAAVVAVTFKTLVVSRRKQFLYMTLAGLALGIDLVFRLAAWRLPLEATGTVLIATVWALFFGFSVVLVSQSIFASHKVTLDTVVGGICVFLMMGYFWFAVYAVIMLVNPDAISGPEGRPEAMDLMYFSMVTLTSLGYGEFVPVSDAAKLAANWEAIVGVLYPAIFIAKLVNSFHDDNPGSDS